MFESVRYYACAYGNGLRTSGRWDRFVVFTIFVLLAIPSAIILFGSTLLLVLLAPLGYVVEQLKRAAFVAFILLNVLLHTAGVADLVADIALLIKLLLHMRIDEETPSEDEREVRIFTALLAARAFLLLFSALFVVAAWDLMAPATKRGIAASDQKRAFWHPDWATHFNGNGGLPLLILCMICYKLGVFGARVWSFLTLLRMWRSSSGDDKQPLHERHHRIELFLLFDVLVSSGPLAIVTAAQVVLDVRIAGFAELFTSPHLRFELLKLIAFIVDGAGLSFLFLQLLDVLPSASSAATHHASDDTLPLLAESPSSPRVPPKKRTNWYPVN